MFLDLNMAQYPTEYPNIKGLDQEDDTTTYKNSAKSVQILNAFM